MHTADMDVLLIHSPVVLYRVDIWPHMSNLGHRFNQGLNSMRCGNRVRIERSRYRRLFAMYRLQVSDTYALLCEYKERM